METVETQLQPAHPTTSRRPPTTSRRPRSNPEAFYDAEAQSITLLPDYPNRSVTAVGMKAKNRSENDVSDADCSLDEDHKYSTVLLESRAKRSWWSCCPTYRSANPDQTVTPFAVILLAVLFGVYVLNQADRLVLPVSIPAGLRCKHKESDCRNLNSSARQEDVSTVTEYFVDPGNASNGSNETADCIEFSDYELGLLTGT